VPCGRRQAFR